MRKYPFILHHAGGLLRIGFEHWAVNLKHHMLVLGRLTIAWHKGPWWQYSTPTGKVWTWDWHCPVYRIGAHWYFEPPWRSNGCSQWGLRITSLGWGPDGKARTIVRYPRPSTKPPLTPEQQTRRDAFVANVLAELKREGDNAS